MHRHRVQAKDQDSPSAAEVSAKILSSKMGRTQMHRPIVFIFDIVLDPSVLIANGTVPSHSTIIRRVG